MIRRTFFEYKHMQTIILFMSCILRYFCTLSGFAFPQTVSTCQSSDPIFCLYRYSCNSIYKGVFPSISIRSYLFYGKCSVRVVL